MRAIWNGSLNFGLVTIPIKLYSATEDHDLRLHQVHEKDHGRIRYQRVCEVCGQVIDMRDIAKAYEAADGQLVLITDDDFASLPADKSKQISVEQFAPREQIDTLLFDRAYYLEPAAPAAKAYSLLRTTLERTDRVAIVRFALRQRTQLGALRVHEGALAVQTLRWPDEIREFEVPRGARNAELSKRELDMAEMLVESYASDFNPQEFTDEYRDELAELVELKLTGGQTAQPAEPDDGDHDAEVVDLLAALERSVRRRSGGGGASTSAPTRGASATTSSSRKSGSSKARSSSSSKSDATQSGGTQGARSKSGSAASRSAKSRSAKSGSAKTARAKKSTAAAAAKGTKAVKKQASATKSTSASKAASKPASHSRPRTKPKSSAATAKSARKRSTDSDTQRVRKSA